MSNRPVDPYSKVTTVMANITMLRVISKARKMRDGMLKLANDQRNAAIQRANERFIHTVCTAATDLDSSIPTLESDDDDDDELGEF